MMNKQKPLQGIDLIKKGRVFALDKKAADISVISIPQEKGISDFFLLCSGDNEIHNRAIADNIITELKSVKTPPWHIEGNQEGRWILIDYSDVIIHIMIPELRSYYQLEDLGEKRDV